MTAIAVPCSKCRAEVRLRDGESSVQCSTCGTTVTRPAVVTVVRRQAPSESGRQGVLAVSLLAVAVGFVALAVTRRRPPPPPPPPSAPTPIYSAPVPEPVAPTPAGAVSWEPLARAPVIAAINGDGVEDIFGFYRVWDGTSAWIAHAGAFDGATLKPLWQTEPIDPQLVKHKGVVPLAVVVGRRIVVADTSPSLRIFDLATGDKQATLRLGGQVVDVCAAPDKAARVWVHVDGGDDVTIDLATEKSTVAPRPKWCAERLYQNPFVPPAKAAASREYAALLTRRATEVALCVDAFENAVNAQASCRVPGPTTEPGFLPRFELTDGTLALALGTKAEMPVAVSTKGGHWVHPFATDEAKVAPGAPVISDLAFGRLYAVTDRVYFDARLAAIDAHTGQTLWESPLLRTLPATDGSERGIARGLVATASRVYVVRAGGALDVFDASSGKQVGTIGKQ